MISSIMYACISCCTLAQADSVSVENILLDEVETGCFVRVIRNTITEHRPVEVEQQSEHGVLVRGGEIRTDMLTLLVSERNQGGGSVVAWTYTESRSLVSGEYQGYIRPTVADVARDEDSILILHIADSRNRLTFLRQSQDGHGAWKATRSLEVDVSSFVRGGQESVGLSGRIVQIGDHTYLHFSHTSIPGHLVLRVDQDKVVEETDPAIVKAVIEVVDPSEPGES